MKIFSVPVNIFRADRLHHCDNCTCRAPRELAIVQNITVAVHSGKPEDAQLHATSHAECLWHEERQKDYGRYSFEAGEPLLLPIDVVSGK